MSDVKKYWTDCNRLRGEHLRRDDSDVLVVLASVYEVAEKRIAELEVFERFAGYLLDHCEGQPIYEESLQYWLSESIKLYKPTESGADK